MNSFQVVAIPTEISESVRKAGRAPKYGFPAHRETAAGRAPCRHCLRLIRINEEELYLFTYDPFSESGVPALPGPVYIHAEACERSHGASSIPEEYRGRLLTFEAYGHDRKLIEEHRLTNGKEDEEAGRLFADEHGQYIHVGRTDAGCYLFRLERRR